MIMNLFADPQNLAAAMTISGCLFIAVLLLMILCFFLVGRMSTEARPRDRRAKAQRSKIPKYISAGLTQPRDWDQNSYS